MPDAPNYSYYRSPRFSTNQLAEYLAASTAEHRERVIRSAKFPKKVAVIPYAQSRQSIAEFLSRNTGDLSFFDEHVQRFETRRRREPDGWMRDEMQRNIDAIAAFCRMFSRLRMRRYKFARTSADLTIVLNGMRINTRLDASMSEENRSGVAYVGGCVLFIANTDAARRNIEDRRKIVAATVHWALEHSNPNLDALPRLCMSVDVFGEAVTKAPGATDRLRGYVRSSCSEAAIRWPHVEPPSDYDGPTWR